MNEKATTDQVRRELPGSSWGRDSRVALRSALPMVQFWQSPSFLHWPYPPRALAAALPAHLTPDEIDGQAWVTVVAFTENVRPLSRPRVPWLPGFPQINVRTYVRADDGTPGVAFLSIEARNPLAVLVARTWFGVPYHLARMRTMGDGRTVTFHSQRRRPHGSALLDLVLTVGDPIPPGSLTELDRFLTMRWAFFGLRHGLLRRTAIDHAEWPLHRAVAERADQTLLAAVGLPEPSEPPVVHYSPGVTAHFGRATPA